jgi:hypothetical protein
MLSATLAKHSEGDIELLFGLLLRMRTGPSPFFVSWMIFSISALRLFAITSPEKRRGLAQFFKAGPAGVPVLYMQSSIFL